MQLCYLGYQKVASARTLEAPGLSYPYTDQESNSSYAKAHTCGAGQLCGCVHHRPLSPMLQMSMQHLPSVPVTAGHPH